MSRRWILPALVALALPVAALAHTTVAGTTPKSGAVLQTVPHDDDLHLHLSRACDWCRDAGCRLIRTESHWSLATRRRLTCRSFVQTSEKFCGEKILPTVEWFCVVLQKSVQLMTCAWQVWLCFQRRAMCFLV